MRRFVYIAVLIAANGCSTVPPNHAQLTVTSEPLGALIYSDATLMGTAPVVLTYQASPGQPKVTTRPLTAVWPSGARVTDAAVMGPPGNRYHFVLQRPIHTPGLQTDLAHEAQLRQLAIAQREQERKEQAAAGALVMGTIISGAAASAYQTDSLYRSMRPMTSFSCTAHGNTVDCF